MRQSEKSSLFVVVCLCVMVQCSPYDDGKYRPSKYSIYDDGKYYRPLNEGKYIPSDEGKYTYVYTQGLYPEDDGDYRYIHQIGPNGENGGNDGNGGNGGNDGNGGNGWNGGNGENGGNGGKGINGGENNGNGTNGGNNGYVGISGNSSETGANAQNNHNSNKTHKIEYIGRRIYAERYPYIHRVINELVNKYVSTDSLYGENSEGSIKHINTAYAEDEVAVKCKFLTEDKQTNDTTEFVTQHPPRFSLEEGEKLQSFYSFKGTKLLDTVSNEALNNKIKVKYEVYVRVVEDVSKTEKS